MTGKMWTPALEAFDEALKINPQHENSLYNSALILYGLHEQTKAIERLKLLTLINPHDEQATQKLKVWLNT